MELKERNNKLIQRAFELLNCDDSRYVNKVVNNGYIDKAYASQISAFSVSVAMIGLKPTLAMYYEKGGAAVDTHNIVGLIAEMLVGDDYKFDVKDPAKALFEYAMKRADDKLRKADDKLRKDVIDNVVALKVVVRTFLKPEKDDESA